MKMKLKMAGKILMMIGLFTLAVQTSAMASESQVTLRVPVNISGLSDKDARSVMLLCYIGKGNPSNRIGRLRLSSNGTHGQGLQLSHGGFSGTVSVRIRKSRHGDVFMVGTPYVCVLNYSIGTGISSSFFRNLSVLAKSGTRPVTRITGRL